MQNIDQQKDILRFEQSLFEIRAALANNENIRKLLLFPTPDALSRESPATDIEKVVTERISLYPITQEGLGNSTKDTAIVLDLQTIDVDYTTDDITALGGLLITAICTDKNYLLDNNKFRSWELAREIANTLEGLKTCLSGKLSVSEFQRVIVKHYHAVSVKIALLDQPGEIRF